jgi:hypothetical protein
MLCAFIIGRKFIVNLDFKIDTNTYIVQNNGCISAINYYDQQQSIQFKIHYQLFNTISYFTQIKIRNTEKIQLLKNILKDMTFTKKVFSHVHGGDSNIISL